MLPGMTSEPVLFSLLNIYVYININGYLCYKAPTTLPPNNQVVSEGRDCPSRTCPNLPGTQ